MPQTENRQPQSAIDLNPRSPFGRHTLVGLNVFFNQFAQQFPDVLGIRVQDPMLGGKGVAPLTTTFNSMIQQADTGTATAAVTRVRQTRDRLVAKVKVENLAGHKFPSGVGFRRAFLTFEVLDADGHDLWVSGRATPTGVLVGPDGKAIPGEFMWKSECQPKSAGEQTFQPHYETITRQDQVQIYQELVRDPRGRLTTSFLSLADVVKDNRLLPRGWTPSVELAEREGLGSPKLSAEELVHHVLPDLPDGRGGQVKDPWYEPKSAGGLGGGGDALTYSIPLADLLGAQPASVRVTLYYQAIPPFYLQDRFCTTPTRPDTARLFFVAGHTDLTGTRAEGWKLQVVSSGTVAVAPQASVARAGARSRQVDASSLRADRKASRPRSDGEGGRDLRMPFLVKVGADREQRPLRESRMHISTGFSRLRARSEPPPLRRQNRPCSGPAPVAGSASRGPVERQNARHDPRPSARAFPRGSRCRPAR